MWRGHGGTRNGVNGILATDPGRKNVETWSKDVIALSVVGEVSTLISKGRSTNSDGLLGGSWGVVARVGVVIASSDGEVDASIDGSIDSQVEGWRFATTQAHVGG
jgi:hypothetical protein